MVRESILLLALLAAAPAAAHQDTRFPVARNGELQRFPERFGSASLTLGPSAGIVLVPRPIAPATRQEADRPSP